MFEAGETDEGYAADLPEKPKGKGGNKARLLTLADLDRRTKAAREARERFSALVSDQGGENNLTASRRALAEQASVFAAMRTDLGVRFLAGEAVDVNTFATIANAERRALETLGLERVAKPVDDLATFTRQQMARGNA